MKMILAPKPKQTLLESIRFRYQRLKAQLKTLKDSLQDRRVRKRLEEEIARNEAVRKELLGENKKR